MRSKEISPFVLLTLVVVVIALASMALAPGGPFRPYGPATSPEETPEPDVPLPGPLAFDQPSWQVGDTWTYESRPQFSIVDQVGFPSGARGSLTRTVVSVDGAIVNVSSAGSFHARWTFSPSPDDPQFSITQRYPMFFDDATMGGYTWYRASDLATLKEVRTIRFAGIVQTDASVHRAEYFAAVETTFDPALDIWSFPLAADEAWTARSVATTRAVVAWNLEVPNAPWTFGRELIEVRPVEVPLRSGAAEDIATPAGTFSAIPVRVVKPDITILTSPASFDVAAGLEQDVPIPRDHTSEAWFSGTAKNVVMVTFGTGGYRLDLTLTRYDVS